MEASSKGPAHEKAPRPNRSRLIPGTTTKVWSAELRILTVHIQSIIWPPRWFQTVHAERPDRKFSYCTVCAWFELKTPILIVEHI